MNFYDNIPEELRKPALWLQYYLSPDPKKPDKKPRKHPCVKYATQEARAENLRSLDYLLENRTPQKGVQRYVDKAEGFTYIDIDRVREPKTGEIQPWAAELIDWLDTYTEISASGTGFHLVCRGTLPEDFKLDPAQVEIYAGNIPNKLIAMTGDVHDLHFAIENRQEQVQELLRRAQIGEFGKSSPASAAHPANWREAFRDPNTLQTGEIPMLIKGILPEGVSLFGSPSGVGKTWMAVSALKALTTGAPYLGVFAVPEIRNCIYLIPEVGDRSLRYRLERLRVPLNPERFLVRTLRDGTMRLNDPLLVQCVEELQPVVFLDTAIRFATAKDENSAAENGQLAEALFNLIRLGARGVVGLHHSPKSTANSDELSLENVLRGTGDLGAMCDAVWGLQHDRGGKGDGEDYLEESKDLTRVFAKCVKPRDFESVEPFRVQGRPYIDERGDFVVLTEGVAPRDERLAAKLVEMVTKNTRISQSALGKATGVSRNRVAEVLSPLGWVWRPSSRTSGEWKPTILSGENKPF
jgi:hypothetical protein